jgi:hypothetical protein
MPAPLIWSEEQIAYLKENWYEPIDGLSKILGVSDSSIHKKLKELGLERPKGKTENMRLRASIYRERRRGHVDESWFQLPSTRIDAKEVGAPKYWDGQPCDRSGHISPRKTSSGGCCQCERLDQNEKTKTDENFRARRASYSRIYYWRNTEKIKLQRADWYQRRGKDIINAWQANARQNNTNFRIAKSLRDRLYKAIQRQETSKNKSAIEMLGCPIEDLIEFIEAQFEEWMNWENHGATGWHIDHVRPCISFDLSIQEQQKVCFNWRNLQPLGEFDNKSKLGGYEKEDECEWEQRMRDLGYEGELFLLYHQEQTRS